MVSTSGYIKQGIVRLLSTRTTTFRLKMSATHSIASIANGRTAIPPWPSEEMPQRRAHRRRSTPLSTALWILGAIAAILAAARYRYTTRLQYHFIRTWEQWEVDIAPEVDWIPTPGVVDVVEMQGRVIKVQATMDFQPLVDAINSHATAAQDLQTSVKELARSFLE